MNDYLGEWHGTDEMGADLSRRFEHYRERLQDTSKRNPLVNFTDRKASTLRVLDPGIGVVWQSITNGKSITFPRPQQGISLVDGEDKSSSVKAAQAAETRERNRREAERLQRDNWLTPKRSGPIKPDAVTTDKTRLQTNRILRSLSRKARTSIEEQGVKTFKVFAKRADKTFPIQSPEIARIIGAKVLIGCKVLKVIDGVCEDTKVLRSVGEPPVQYPELENDDDDDDGVFEPYPDSLYDAA